MPGPFSTGSRRGVKPRSPPPTRQVGCQSRTRDRGKLASARRWRWRGPEPIAGVAWGSPRETSSAWRRIALGSAPAGFVGGCRPGGPNKLLSRASAGQVGVDPTCLPSSSVPSHPPGGFRWNRAGKCPPARPTPVQPAGQDTFAATTRKDHTSNPDMHFHPLTAGGRYPAPEKPRTHLLLGGAVRTRSLLGLLLATVALTTPPSIDRSAGGWEEHRASGPEALARPIAYPSRNGRTASSQSAGHSR